MIKKNEIYIRILSKDDVTERYLSWFKDDLVTRFLDSKNLSKDEVLSYLKHGHESGSYYIYAICLKSSNLHIGNIKVGPIRRKDGISDLVTVIGDKDYWGKSVARNAIKHAVDLGFDVAGIRKFSASINSLNTSSVKAYLGGGFKIDATIKNYFYNKIDNDYIVSDKIFVGYENNNFNMKSLENWKPVN